MNLENDPARPTGALDSPAGVSLDSVQTLTEVFVCPRCRGALRYDGQGLVCPPCSVRGRYFAENMVDFLGGEEAHSRIILNWRDDQLPDIEEAVFQKRQADNGKPVSLSPEQTALLEAQDLLGPDGGLTPLGRMAAYNTWEFRSQTYYDPLEGLVPVPELTPRSRVLDLGGGSGQTLRRLFPKPQGTVVCLDLDLDILAYGAKLFSAYGLNALFCRGSAHSLPFRDGDFDYIICRGVINYTHQKRALREAVRVLRPGGWLFLRFENIHWDFNALSQKRDLRTFIIGIRWLFWGLIHAGLGYQPTPGSRIAGCRAYISPRRFRTILASLDTQIVRDEPSRRGPQHRDHATQDVALCIRKPTEALDNAAVPNHQRAPESA